MSDCNYDMLPTMPLVQFNTKCSYSTKRGLLGLLSRFESSEITPEFVKALLSLRAPQQHQVMRRMTDAAVACLQMYITGDGLSNNDTVRLKNLIGRYKTSKTRILTGARDMVLKEQKKRPSWVKEKLDARDEWGDKFINVSKYPNVQVEILRRILYQKPTKELIAILDTSKNKALYLQVIYILKNKFGSLIWRITRKTKKERRKILSAFLRTLESPYLEVRDVAIKSFEKTPFCDYDHFLNHLFGLSCNKSINPNIRDGAARILVRMGEVMLKIAEKGGCFVKEGERAFKRMPAILVKVAQNTKLPKVREMAGEISLKIKKCLQDRDRCGR